MIIFLSDFQLELMYHLRCHGRNMLTIELQICGKHGYLQKLLTLYEKVFKLIQIDINSNKMVNNEKYEIDFSEIQYIYTINGESIKTSVTIYDCFTFILLKNKIP